MSLETVTTANAPGAIGPYSQAVQANGFVFCSGQIALTKDGELLTGDITAQTRQVLRNLEAILEAAGTSVRKVVKTTVYLSSIQNFVEFNEAYAEFFKDHKPARATVESPHLPKGVLIEIDCIAVM